MHDDEQEIRLECDHDDSTSGKRNRYYFGKRMRPTSFEVEQKYHIERRRLLNRAIHGWGVVYGFELRYQSGPVNHPSGQDGDTTQQRPQGGGQRPRRATLGIGEGLALDRAGRELMQVGERCVSARDVYVSDEDREWLRGGARPGNEQRIPPRDGAGEDGGRPEACWLLNVHYAERLEGPLRVKDDCSCDRAEWDYLCETVWYSVERVDAGRCRGGQPCELGCDCRAADPCAEHPEPSGRGSHQCMSRYLSRLDPNAERICMTGQDGQLQFDRANAIPLARVGLGLDECGDLEFTALLDDWGPRRLVKRNDMLFDLIRGCDLTRISEISWKDWHRSPHQVDWNQFAGYFETTTGKEFKVTFSGPVQRDTVTVDCFAMSVVVADSSGWGEPRRVPLAGVRLSEPDDCDPRDSARSATLIVDAEWIADELGKSKKNSLFSNGPSLVEIEVRTGFILDVWGQAVDGSPIGAQPAPTGNGSPGGRFLSTFRVSARPRPNGNS